MYMISKDTIIEIKKAITPDRVFSLLQSLDARPRFYKSNIIVARTICHNGDSHKLYYYTDSQNFHCYTNCGSLDIIELIRKVQNYDFIQAVAFLIDFFNLHYLLENPIEEETNKNAIQKLEEKYFAKRKGFLNQKKEFSIQKKVQLPIYDDSILNNFSYPRILSWEREGISRDIMIRSHIGYYPGGGQITIPHYDENNNLIGIRGRYLGKEEAAMFGKYRPIYVNGESYSHPLGFNLYNLNFSKDNIKKISKAIVFEGEKSCLAYASFFGQDSDISVATCGSALSDYQINLLIEAGAKEIVIAFDRQFQEIGDKEFHKLTEMLIQLNKKYKKIITISFIFDKEKITDYKDAPVDKGADVFIQLFKERIIL